MNEEKKENNINEKSEIIITEEYYNKCKEQNYIINDFCNLSKYLRDKDPQIQLKGLVGIRKLCMEEKKKENAKPIYNVLIRYLFDFIKDYPEEFQYEALICLINIEVINIKLNQKIKEIPKKELIDFIFLKLKNTKNLKLGIIILNAYLKYLKILLSVEKILKEMIPNTINEIILNIIKDYINEPNIIKRCLKIIKNIYDQRDVQNMSSSKGLVIPNYCFQNSIDIIPLLSDIIIKYKENIKILKISLIILSDITSDSKENKLNKIIELNILPKLIELTDNDNYDIIYYSLKTIGNFAMNEKSDFTDILINLNVLEVLKNILEKENEEKNINIRKESSFIISNIAAGTQNQISKLFEMNFYKLLHNIIINEEEGKIKNNCLWAIYNLSCIENEEYLEQLIKNGYLTIIMNRFNIDYGDTLTCSLEALNNLLKYKKKVNSPAIFSSADNELNNLDIFNALKNLKNKGLEPICKDKINFILKNYFEVENENES